MSKRTNQKATIFGQSRRSLALGEKDPRARREADARLNGGLLATDKTIVVDSATGRLTVNIDEVRKRLEEK